MLWVEGGGLEERVREGTQGKLKREWARGGGAVMVVARPAYLHISSHSRIAGSHGACPANLCACVCMCVFDRWLVFYSPPILKTSALNLYAYKHRCMFAVFLVTPHHAHTGGGGAPLWSVWYSGQVLSRSGESIHGQTSVSRVYLLFWLWSGLNHTDAIIFQDPENVCVYKYGSARWNDAGLAFLLTRSALSEPCNGKHVHFLRRRRSSPRLRQIDK